MDYVARTGKPRSLLSYKKRKLCYRPIDIVNGERYARNYHEAATINDILACMFGIQDSELLEREKAAFLQLHQTYFCRKIELALLLPYSRVCTCTSVEAALSHCGVEGAVEFEHIFHFTPSETKLLAPLLFAPVLSLRKNKRGNIGNEELLMILCAKFRKVLGTGQRVASFFGRDPAFISAAFHLGVRHLLKRFSKLLEFRKLSKWRCYTELWNEKYREVYAKDDENSELPGRWLGCNCAVDGVRLYVAKNKEAMVNLSNPYVGNEPTYVFLGIAAPNGLIIGMSEPICGNNNDSGAALLVNLNEHLKKARLVAIADSIFALTTNVKPIPKKDEETVVSANELKRVSSLRVQIEWAFGEVQSSFPLIADSTRMKVDQTAPTSLFQASVLLSNFSHCLRGSNANTYFNEGTLDIHKYLNMI